MKFVIPNFFTLSNLILGFICIINIFNNPTNSTVLYLFYLCLILDFLDGFFARKFNVVSEFGKQLDSFADFVSFCILPSLVLYFYLGNTAGKYNSKISTFINYYFLSFETKQNLISQKIIIIILQGFQHPLMDFFYVSG